MQELVAEELKQHFFEIRVDHLNEYKLNFELEIREIVFDDNESMTRKRRALREMLKNEKSAEHPVYMLKRSPSEDFQACIAKFEEIEGTIKISAKGLPPRCQSRLLHLGNRLILLEALISEEEREKLMKMQEAVLSYLNRYFYGKRSVVSEEQEDTGIDRLFIESENPVGRQDEAIGQITQPSSTGQMKTGSLLEDEKDIVESLQRLGLLNTNNLARVEVTDVKDALLSLEYEINLLRRFRDLHSILPDNQIPTIIDAHLPQVNRTTYTGTVPKNTRSSPAASSHSFTSGGIDSFASIDPTVHNSMSSFVSSGTTPSYSIARAVDPRLVPELSTSYPMINFQTLTSTTSTGPRVTSTMYAANPYLTMGCLSTSQVQFNVPAAIGFNTTAASQFERESMNWTRPSVDPWRATISPVTNSIPTLTSTMGLQGQQMSTNNNFNSLTSNSQLGHHTAQSIQHPASTMEACRGQFGHKSLPVSKWKLNKYAGTDQGLKLNEFLVLVSQLALSERISEPELFDSALHLFTGPALNWYMTMRSSGRLASWQHLVSELRKAFAHPELDSLVRTRIYQRRQQRNETFQEYYYDMESMFRSMIVPMSDAEQLDVLKRNMRSDYKKTLLWKPIFSLPDLLEAGHIIDASNFSLYAKVFGHEKTSNAVSEIKIDKGDPKNFSNRPPFKPTTQQGSNPSKFKDDNSKKKGGTDEKKTNQPIQAGRSKEMDPKEGPSKPTRTLDMLIEAHRPPRSYECLYCRHTNHALEQCRSYRGSICMVCGFKGFETQNCPYCQKNGLQTARNRGPSNPNA